MSADTLIHTEAEERLLSDMDGYADWLYGKCMGSTPEHCRIGYVPRDSVRFTQFVESLDVPQLLSLSLYPRAEVALAACQALRDRFVADMGPRLSELEVEVSVSLQEAA